MEAVRGRFDQETVEGQEVWFAPGQDPTPTTELTAHLLPSYDEYLIAYAERSALLDKADRRHIARGNGLSATVEVGGRIVGTWKRTLLKERVEVAIQLFRPVGAEEIDAIRVAAKRYGAFLGLRAEISGF
jgi:hypothetical protein